MCCELVKQQQASNLRQTKVQKIESGTLVNKVNRANANFEWAKWAPNHFNPLLPLFVYNQRYEPTFHILNSFYSSKIDVCHDTENYQNHN